MPQELITIGELAKQVGVDRWRLAYLIEKGKLPSPSAQVPGRRLFSPEDVEKIKNALEAMQEGASSHRPPPGGQAVAETARSKKSDPVVGQ